MLKIITLVALMSIFASPHSEAQQNRDVSEHRDRTWPPVYPEGRDHRNDIIWSVPRPGGGYTYFGGGKQLQTCQPSSIGGQICH